MKSKDNEFGVFGVPAFPVPPLTHSVILVICGCLKSWGQGSLQNLTEQIPWDNDWNKLFGSLFAIFGIPIAVEQLFQLKWNAQLT